MNRNMKIFMSVVAVFCSYLILSLPFSSALQINLIFNQVSLDSVIINPQGLVSKELSIEHDTLWSKVNAHLEIRVSQPQYEIKRAYIYFCGGMDPIDCITKDPVTFESYVNVSKNWNDILSGQQYQYPQTTNILSIVRVDIGGKITWTGFWDQIERTATREFKIRSFDTSSLDVYLKSLEDLNLTKSFIENYRMVPAQWVESTSFGMINQIDTQVLYGIGADQTEMPQFRPWKTIGKTVGEIGKEYELIFPGTSSLTANPVTINSNPPYVCGNSVCETGSGESQENCCVDCTEPETRACTGDLEGYTCYTDADNPYGYCGSKCGENGCELGEDAGTCCLDCSCDTGFLCDVSSWLPSGSCINSSAINLILDSAKTTYKSCEIPHDVELSAHVMNAPSDLRVQQWYYVLNINETGTSISSQRIEVVEGPNVSAPHMYNLKIHLDPLPECVRGTHTIEQNRLFALVTYSDGKEFKELSTNLPTITIHQESISMKEIQENVKDRMQAVMDFIEDGMALTKLMLKVCLVTLIMVLLTAIVGGVSYAFGGEGVSSELGGGTGVAGIPGSAIEIGEILSLQTASSGQVIEGATILLPGTGAETEYKVYDSVTGKGFDVKATTETAAKQKALNWLVIEFPESNAAGEFSLGKLTAIEKDFIPKPSGDVAAKVYSGTSVYAPNGWTAKKLQGYEWNDKTNSWGDTPTTTPKTELLKAEVDAWNAKHPNMPLSVGNYGKVGTFQRTDDYVDTSTWLGEPWAGATVRGDNTGTVYHKSHLGEMAKLKHDGEWWYEDANGNKNWITGEDMKTRENGKLIQTRKSDIKRIPGFFSKVATGFGKFFNEYGKALEIGLNIVRMVCQMVQLLISVFTSLTQVWTKYITFQTCMELYENYMGRGQCDQNPKSCTDQLLGCLNSLGGIERDIEGITPELGRPYYKGGVGVEPILGMYELGKLGAVTSTCGSRSIYFKYSYGKYSELRLRVQSPATADVCPGGMDILYSEAEMKQILPTKNNPMPALSFFECGEGHYRLFLIANGASSTRSLGIKYESTCDKVEGKAGDKERDIIGDYFTPAVKKLNTVIQDNYMKDQTRKDLLDKVIRARDQIQFVINECEDGKCDATPVMNALNYAISGENSIQYVIDKLPSGAPPAVKGSLESALKLAKTGKTELQKYIE